MLVNLNDVLKDAQRGGYAVGLFNATDTDMLQATLEAAEELHSPIIIGTAEILLKYGELSLISPSMINAAKNASVPVVVHYDHGLTYERCIEALRLGYSSIMFDASLLDYGENVKQTRELVKIAHMFGATVEGEVGHVGNADIAGVGDIYTSPEIAAEYIENTGVDACAVAFGTAHGAYLKQPKLDFERLKSIRAVTDVPLVMHGGSGLTDESFRTAVKCGVAKINIFTDLCVAGSNAMKRASDEGIGYLEARNMKVREIKNEVKKKILLFGSDDRA